MLEQLKEKVYLANMELSNKGLVVYTWGNVSGIDRESGYVVIKPSGIAYDEMKVSDMVVVDLDGNVIEGQFKPSSDTPTHLALYQAFQEIGGIVHTHSRMATSFAQAGKSIPPLGTTHADYFYGPIPCTRPLVQSEIQGSYEHETGQVIIETLKGCQVMDVPAVLVCEHGPFTWGKDPWDAVYHSVVLEEVAVMAMQTIQLKALSSEMAMDQDLLDKHFLRKHGQNAYYGQK